MVQSVRVVAKVKKDFNNTQGLKNRLQGDAIGGSSIKGGRLEFMHINNINTIPRLHKESNKGDAPMAGEAYPLQVDVKAQKVPQKALKYPNKG